MSLSLPYCLDIEITLLAACLAEEVAPIVEPQDFGTECHQHICRAMRDLALSGSRPDISLTAEAVQRNSSGRFGPVEVAHVAQFAASGDNIDRYSAIVREYAVARRLQVRAQGFVHELSERGTKSPGELVRVFCADVSDLGAGGSRSNEVTAREGMSRFVSDLDNRMQRGLGLVGLPTGIARLDRLTLGMEKGGLWIVAARPSMGKTALALQIVRHVLGLGRKVLIFSLDMSSEGLFQRFVSREAHVNLQAIRSGLVDKDEYRRIAEASEILFSLDLVIDDSPSTEFDVLAKVRRHRPALVVIDYLQKISPSRPTGNLNVDFGQVTKLLKNIGKELQIPVLLLSQLSRKNEQENRQPRESDLRDSGQIEQDADVICFLHSQDSDKSAKTRQLILAKQRQGSAGVSFTMAFLGEYQSFETLVLGA